jgi:hypothetical protein
MHGRVTTRELPVVDVSNLKEEVMELKNGKLQPIRVMGKTKRHKYIRRGYVFEIDGEYTAKVAEKLNRPVRGKEIVYVATEVKPKKVVIGTPVSSKGFNKGISQVKEFQDKLIRDLVKDDARIIKVDFAEPCEDDEVIGSVPMNESLSREEVEDLLFDGEDED